MTYYEYAQKLFANGIAGVKTIVENDHKALTLNDDTYERIMIGIRLSIDKQYADIREVMPGLNTAMLRTQIVYDLYRLDKLGFKVDACSSINTGISSGDLISYYSRGDMRMRNFPNNDAKCYFVAILVSIAMLYAISTGKKVEAKLLSKLTVQDMRNQELYDSFERAQSILNDIRKYNNRAAFYDARLLYFLPKPNVSGQPRRPAF